MSKEKGIRGFFSILKYKYRLFIWKSGVIWEVTFWDRFLHNKHDFGSDKYKTKLDPDLLLQARPAALLPSQTEINVLDVGAGPLTVLGKQLKGKQLHIIAVDPLAEMYDRILQKHNIVPIVRTQKLFAEELSSRFPEDTFDLVYARNCLDHSNDPERAILQMINVVKRGCYVLLEHHPNVAFRALFTGLHQWNFTVSAKGDFIISSGFIRVNMTEKYADRCIIKCEIVKEQGEWLITRILKT